MDDFEYENEQALIDSFEDAIDAASTPMGALAAAYNHAPHPVIREWLNQRAADILQLELPNVRQVLRDGPAALAEEREGVLEIFEHAMDALEITDPHSLPSATCRQMGEDIARYLDNNIGRVLLDETQYNRKVWYDLIAAHAQLVSALDSLVLTEEQKQLVAEVAELDRQDDEDGAAPTLH